MVLNSLSNGDNLKIAFKLKIFHGIGYSCKEAQNSFQFSVLETVVSLLNQVVAKKKSSNCKEFFGCL